MAAPAFEVVVLARHGQTEWNAAGRRQGQLDSPLTALGQAQAAATAQAVAALPIDGVFSSPLGRALDTAAAAGLRLDLPVTVLAELAEVHHGELAGLTRTQIDARFPGALAARRQNLYRWAFPGGESYADADRRASVALSVIAASGARRPLVVSHEMIGRMLARALLGAAADTALTWQQPNDILLHITPSTHELRAVKVGAPTPPCG
ncbi:histidine phosphatase family protein [Blastococcus goldschmidtiae]|uniref:Histidine phosphatase family protein n=1 Tax=Blastococcus goldschmidtiae TaxID=3075546 RepID=A0ABU2KCE7_9ACTN|nr:histidine phosphatase family protein [Blastococcus sp. DSM 46792]MDT0277866.1 histidine phosphatase family protein [Blastococcus sp. DSM 46792]